MTLALAVTGALGLAPAALADEGVSSNWAGYAVHGASFRSVWASWRQPQVVCARGQTTYSAYWVGLGGFSQNAQALEQIGTDADCTSSGRATYSAWYELVPRASVDITSLTIRAGDRLSASVDVRGHAVKVRLANLTRGRTFARTVTASQVDTTSAEWIVEAPSLCDTQLSFCETQSLANFGTAQFADAKATTAAGHTGPIADAAWHQTAISLSGASGGPDFGPQRFTRDRSNGAGATPSALSASGSSFMVSYAASTPAAANAPTMPGDFGT